MSSAASGKPYRSEWLNEGLDALRDSAQRFRRHEFAPHLEQWLQQGCVDPAAWREAGEAGLLCVGIPEEYGGGGGTFAHAAVVIEELERSGIGHV